MGEVVAGQSTLALVNPAWDLLRELGKALVAEVAMRMRAPPPPVAALVVAQAVSQAEVEDEAYMKSSSTTKTQNTKRRHVWVCTSYHLYIIPFAAEAKIERCVALGSSSYVSCTTIYVSYLHIRACLCEIKVSKTCSSGVLYTDTV